MDGHVERMGEKSYILLIEKPNERDLLETKA
jgi:hypothetical protein